MKTTSGTKHYDCQVDEMMDDEGQPMGRVIILRDITASKIAQDALKESEERYRAIFDQFLGSIFVVDLKDGSVLQANQSFCHFFGYTEEEVRGLKMGEIKSIDGSIVNQVMDAVRKGDRLVVETTASRLDGKSVIIGDLGKSHKIRGKGCGLRHGLGRHRAASGGG